MRYSAAYKIGLASALAVALLGTLQGLLVQGFLKEAARLGYTKLDELTDDVIVKLTPNKDTVARGLELAQHVVDHEHERDFDAAEVLAVFCMNDAGNKKKDKLTQRLYAAWNKALGKVVLHHHASTKVKAAGLAETVRVDLEQLNVPADHVLGGITDNAPDHCAAHSAPCCGRGTGARTRRRQRRGNRRRADGLGSALAARGSIGRGAPRAREAAAYARAEDA
jgi:hypothetical protein